MVKILKIVALSLAGIFMAVLLYYFIHTTINGQSENAALADAAVSHVHVWRVVEYNVETRLITLECEECGQISSSILTEDILTQIEESDEWENAVDTTIVKEETENAGREVVFEGEVTLEEGTGEETKEDAGEQKEKNFSSAKAATIMISSEKRANIRSGPGGEFPTVEKFAGGATIYLDPSSETDGWTALADGSGWIKNTLFEYEEE